MPHKNKTKRILFALIQPSIAMILAFTVVNIISMQMTATVESIQEKRTAYAILERRAETIEAIKDDFATISPNAIAEMESVFPPTDNIIGFIVWVEGLAPENNKPTLNFGSPRPFISSEALDVSAINYNMSFSGNASTLLGYIETFETAPYLTATRSVTINASGANGWETNATMNIQGDFYAKTIE